MSFIAEYPLWLTLLCLALGVLAALVLYYKTTDLNETSKNTRRFLAVLRFVTVSVIAFLFLSPFIERNIATEVKPLLVFAQDNSESVLFNNDSAFYKDDFPKELAKIKEEMAIDYEIVSLTFGDRIEENDSLTFLEKYSDYDQLLSTVEGKYINRNLGALVVSGDGIYTKGLAPEYRAASFPVPIFSVFQGDSTRKQDLAITEIAHNRTAFVDTEMPIELYVVANGLANKKTKLVVKKRGKSVFEQDISITGERFSKKIEIKLKAGKAGMHFYTFSLQAVEGESNTKNNQRTIAVEVIENKEKILILTSTAHPDIAALKHAIQSNIMYEVVVKAYLEESTKLSDFALIILYQIPNVNLGTKELKRIEDSKVACWYFVGKQTNLPEFNQMNNLLTISTKSGYNDVNTEVNPNFTLFSKDAISEVFEDTPPLTAHFGEYKPKSKADVFLTQQIKGVSTNVPMLLFGKNEGKKEAVFVGEGIWRLRISNFRKDQNHRKFNTWLNKAVQYLSLKEKKDRFRINIPKISDEGRTIHIEAEVYNKSQELINQHDVKVQIADSIGNLYDFLLEPYGTKYGLDLGSFPVGEYSYSASAELPDETLKKKGKFSVRPLNLESVNTVGNPLTLRKLAIASGGSFFTKETIGQIENAIRKNEQIRPVLIENQKLTNLAQLKGIFFFLLVLLALEWALRKYFGSY